MERQTKAMASAVPSVKKVCGVFLVGLPFIVFTCISLKEVGLIKTIGIYALAFAIVGSVAAGMWMIYPDDR
jgi:hypothetical protein